MRNHPQHDMLSAFLDGELDAADKTVVESHLPECAECRETLDGLRATMADFAALPAAEPSTQDSWALRSAIASARAARASRRYPRYAMAAAGAAASIVAIFAFASQQNALNGGTSETASGATADYSVLDANFDEKTARALIGYGTTSGSAATGGGAAAEGVTDSAGPRAVPAPALPATSANGGQWSADRTRTQAMRMARGCEREVAPANGNLSSSFQARFKNKPAYFFVFSVRDGDDYHLELWVTTTAAGCDVVYFAQRDV